MKKNILVVGSPRSGTSMLAGIFANQGYHIGNDSEDELRPGDAANPGGYWEAESLIERNVEVFRAAGYEDHNTWLFDPIPDEAAERISTLDPRPGHADFVAEQQEPWLWKDPRLCYTLGYWWKLMDPEKTRVILTDRDPGAIYRSFLRLHWREEGEDAEADVLKRVADHSAAARRAIEALEIPYLSEPYERFAAEPEAVARALSDFMGMDLTTADLQFDSRYDHSSLKGRLKTALILRAQRLPPGVKGAIKRLVPRGLLARVSG